MKTIFENKQLWVVSFFLKPLASLILIPFQNFPAELDQSGIKVKPNVFVSVSLFISLMYAVSLSALLIAVFYIANILDSTKIAAVLLISLLIFFFNTFYLMSYPKLLLYARIREIDRSLLFALRHILIKVRSGIPFFNSIAGVAYSDYGYVSGEFRKAVKDIEGGTNETTAIEKLSFYNPSPFFRKFIWQIANSLRAGTDIAKTLEVIVKDIQQERYIQIKEFAGRLSPIALMYIMFTVVIPSLSITFLTVFTFFFGISINNQMFYLIPAVLMVLNLFFMNIIKSTIPIFEME